MNKYTLTEVDKINKKEVKNIEKVYTMISKSKH